MADISKAGTQTYMVEGSYDPSKMTLNEYIGLYETESTAQEELDKWINEE